MGCNHQANSFLCKQKKYFSHVRGSKFENIPEKKLKISGYVFLTMEKYCGMVDN